MAGLSIGDVATRAGLRTSTLRYYEQVGLIPPPLRISGRRLYDPGVFSTLALIAVAKEAGFTIDETRRLLTGFTAGVPAPARWQTLAQRKERELDATIARARRMKRLLHRVATKCRCASVNECGQRFMANGRALQRAQRGRNVRA